MYQSTKRIDGFSTCFRQHGAKTHCNRLHGYALEFKVTFEAETLDDKNWVMDFGFTKHELPLKHQIEDIILTAKDWLSYIFDHTTVIALDDPELETFKVLDMKKVIRLMTMKNVGCEAFAELVFNFIKDAFDNDRVKIISVECIENKNNSAIYYGKR